MVFPSVQRAQAFFSEFLRGTLGEPLLTLTPTDGGRVAVSGVWEDHCGIAAAVVRENRLVWADHAGYAVRSRDRDNAVALTLGDDALWEIALHDGRVDVKGLFFTADGMVIIKDWGAMLLRRDEIIRMLEAALLERATLWRRPRMHARPTRRHLSCGRLLH